MDKTEARTLLEAEIRALRLVPYEDLVRRLLDEQETREVIGPSGARYQIELQAIWDEKPDGPLRVVGSVDDGGFRAFVPLTDDFIVSPDGSFIGE